MVDLYGDDVLERETYEEEEKNYFFEYLNAITYKKVDIIGDDEYIEKKYNPYFINKSLSQHVDCVFFVNEMNIRPFTDRKMQFDFLINSIRKKFRKGEKWLKPELIDDIECVKEYFSYNNDKAKQALKILSSSDIEMIKYKLRRGGKNDKYDGRN